MFCFHKWGEIKDRYQYCSKCGVARKVECNHIWESEKAGDTFIRERQTGQIHIMTCKICGEKKNHIVSVNYA